MITWVVVNKTSSSIVIVIRRFRGRNKFCSFIRRYACSGLLLFPSNIWMFCCQWNSNGVKTLYMFIAIIPVWIRATRVSQNDFLFLFFKTACECSQRKQKHLLPSPVSLRRWYQFFRQQTYLFSPTLAPTNAHTFHGKHIFFCSTAYCYRPFFCVIAVA